MGRGVATEYPSGFSPCPDMTAVDPRTNTATAARDIVRPLPFVLSVIGCLLAVLIKDETVRSHIFAVVFLVPSETIRSQLASNPLKRYNPKGPIGLN
jgi:hypothetical protein